MIASLPMYDWPEVRGASDTLWAFIRDAMRAQGINAPEALDRLRPSPEVWTDPALVLSQTCSMPFRLGLNRVTALVGTPDYAVEGCPPGYYCSVIVVREGETRGDLGALTCAVNALDSQSGHAVWQGRGFEAQIKTGSHAASIKAVARGAADIAAIDAVTWRLALAHLLEANALRVLARTPPTPGLPFITAKGRDTEPLAVAAEAGIASLDPENRAALGLVGFVRLPASTYCA